MAGSETPLRISHRPVLLNSISVFDQPGLPPPGRSSAICRPRNHPSSEAGIDLMNNQNNSTQSNLIRHSYSRSLWMSCETVGIAGMFMLGR